MSNDFTDPNEDPEYDNIMQYQKVALGEDYSTKGQITTNAFAMNSNPKVYFESF